MIMESTERLSRPSSAFALAAAITVIFNTALAWAKDSSPALKKFMVSITGHHWTCHALADVVVFFGLGFLLMATGVTEKIDSRRLIVILIVAVILASLGLAGWNLVF
jgi:hypothetical protein